MVIWNIGIGIITGKFGPGYCRRFGGTEGGGYLCGGGPLFPAFGTGNLCAILN